VKFKSLQYPVEDPDVLFGETSIQDQPILAVLFIATTKFEESILCNYKVKRTNHGSGKGTNE
jgi:hypothetical protein